MQDPWLPVETPAGECRVYSLTGERDLAGGRLERELTDALTNGVQAVVVDCSGLAFLDRATIDGLLAASTALGDRLVVVAPPGRVREVLEIAGLDTLLRVTATREEALAALGGEL